MQLTSTVRTEAAVARLLKAVPPPLTWYLVGEGNEPKSGCKIEPKSGCKIEPKSGCKVRW